MSQRRIAQWDKRAATFDAQVAGLERRFLASSRRWVCARAHGRTLEVAIGTGASLPHYAADIELTAIEWSPAMLDVARQRAMSLGRAVDLHVGDATALPFGDDSFDAVVCTYALCSIPDVRAALQEAIRVVRPGGSILLADHVLASSWPLQLVQRALEVVSVPLQGEHYTRRPSRLLAELGLTVEASARRHAGVIERVHARVPD